MTAWATAVGLILFDEATFADLTASGCEPQRQVSPLTSTVPDGPLEFRSRRSSLNASSLTPEPTGLGMLRL